jgi:hypothetical protein
MQRVLTTLLCRLTLVVLVSFATSTAQAADGEQGFTSMFNGKDLTGWEGKEGWWYVEDGTITSQSTPEKPCTKCNYLMWRGGKPGDFELRLRYRIVGGNSGIQFRSQERPDWDTYGYQADIDAAGQWAGALFEHARGGIAMRGERVVVDENGKKQVTSLGVSAELMKHIKLEDWNEYCVTARGSEITLAINGVVMSQAIDHEKGKAARDGIIALQVHPGPPMKIQFKDLRIKLLDQAKP